MASSGQVHKFRETFGDAKPPDITRKITACVACRKQKVWVNVAYLFLPSNRGPDQM